MGSIIGGIAQGVGAYEGAQAEASAAENATNAAQQGYRYLTTPGTLANNEVTNIENTGNQATTNQAGTQNQLMALLGLGGPASAPGVAGVAGAPGTTNNQASQAFNNYLGSTGYQFQLGQGTQAVNAQAATSGMLNSGANAKALETYGQNLSSTTFGNYLSQLGGLNAAQGATAQAGQNMLGQVATVGTASGQGAANAILQGGAAQGNFFAGLGGAAGNMLGSLGGGSSSSSILGLPSGTTGFGGSLGGLFGGDQIVDASSGAYGF